MFNLTKMPESGLFEFVTNDRRHFFGRIVDGNLHLNTKSDFNGRNVRISSSELADMLFKKARVCGAIHQRFGNAREVRPRSEKQAIPVIFGKRQSGVEHADENPES